METIDRYRGCLLGLAVGDAVGTTVEFRAPGTFEPLTDMVGGGPFRLEPGQWTDDTSMALCLAESLIARQGFDPLDQMQRYTRWYREGHLSSTGTCFDIGNTVRDALLQFERTRKAYSGSTHPMAAGNGSLMRLAPAPLAYARAPREAIRKAGESSRTTHGAAAAIAACRYFAALIVGAVGGVSQKKLLSKAFSPAPDLWEVYPLVKEIDEIAMGSFKTRQPPEIAGTGYVVRSLEAALWAFYHSEDFREGCLLAANLGNDADTTAAIYGQLAGAYYGWQGIPAAWREQVALRGTILQMAAQLWDLAHGGDF